MFCIQRSNRLFDFNTTLSCKCRVVHDIFKLCHCPISGIKKLLDYCIRTGFICNLQHPLFAYKIAHRPNQYRSRRTLVKVLSAVGFEIVLTVSGISNVIDKLFYFQQIFNSRFAFNSATDIHTPRTYFIDGVCDIFRCQTTRENQLSHCGNS